MSNSELLKRQIVLILQKNPEGVTVQYISGVLGVHRQTATKYIFELVGAGVVKRRPIGSATLHYLVEQHTGKEWEGVIGE